MRFSIPVQQACCNVLTDVVALRCCLSQAYDEWEVEQARLEEDQAQAQLKARGKAGKVRQVTQRRQACEYYSCRCLAPS